MSPPQKKNTPLDYLGPGELSVVCEVPPFYCLNAFTPVVEKSLALIYEDRQPDVSP